MQSFKSSCQLATLVMALATCCYGQSHPVLNSNDSEADKVNDLPTRQVTFSAGDPVNDIKASPALILPMQCTGDGALFFDMLQPPSFMQQAVYSVTLKSSQSFSVSAIADLHDVHQINFFPTKDHVFLLVHATKEASPAAGDTVVRQSSYAYFVAVFNRQGNYEHSIKLTMHDVLPSHIAVLTSGEYLVTGYDRANDMPRLYLVDSDGQLIRPLVLPEILGKYIASDDSTSAKAAMNQSKVLGSILMTAHGDEVLLWRRGARGPILGIGAKGSTREIPLDVPKGLTLGDVLPSDKSWIAQFQAENQSDTHQWSYYQFDPSDGTENAKSLIGGDSPEHIPAIIACEENGTFLSYQTDDKGQLRILSTK
jgi:hypothetical protein